MPEALAARVRDGLREAIQGLGLTSEQVEIHFHDAKTKFEWKPPNLADTTPSPAQMGFAKKLLTELRVKSRGDDSELKQRARELLMEVEGELATGNVTKKLISPAIDAMKDAIADLDFEAKGIRYLEN
jgi:hypothetical protein